MSIWPPVCHPEDQHLQLFMNNSNFSLANHQSSSFHMVEATSDELLPTLVPLDPDPSLHNSDDIILYKYLVLKVFFLIWDVVGAFLNGLGIDLLWHRVEINHAVYSIVLHDIILALISSVVTLVINTFFWSDDLAWFRIHALLNLLPFLFHNWAWAIISNLRCVNITQSDDWFELDQDVTRRYSLYSTWAIALINYLPLVPYILVNLGLYRNSIESFWAVLFYSGLVISFVLATYHYVRIYLFARSTEQSQSLPTQPQFGANAGANFQSPSPLPNLTVSQGGTQSNVFPDFSEDEDLLDTPESPSIKQAAAVVSALRTMILVTLIPLGILVIQVYYRDSLWANALMAFLLTFFKSPGILCISIFNFGPIRNQVGVYMEDFPDHFRDTVQPVIDWINNFCACLRTASNESDERNIVEAGDDLEQNAISPPIKSKSRLNIVGKRDSAVSPTNSEMLPEVQC